MAATTAPTKQTLHNQPALVALGDVLHLLPHHTKAYRKRHLLILLITLAFVATMIIELAAIMTRQSLDPRNLVTPSTSQTKSSTLTQVRSSNGFAFSFNNEQFTPTALGEGYQGHISDSELRAKKALSSVTLTPLPSRVPAVEAATELAVTVESDEAAFAVFKTTATPGRDITSIVADYFAPKTNDLTNIVEESRTTESIGGTLMTKAVYKVTPKFAGNPTHSIVWSAEVAGRPLAVTIKGLVTGPGVPSSMGHIMTSMQLESAAKVEGISTVFQQNPEPEINQKYIAEKVTPAVVKIYHTICGTLVFENNVLSEDTCSGSMGSGFLVSSDGYVATNGHVVVYGAKDMLVNALLNNNALLEQFLSGSKLSSAQIKEVLTHPELTASVVSKIYDIPDTSLRLVNQRERTVVALGDTPLELQDEGALRKHLEGFVETENLKQATVIGYDYAAKDQLTVVADPAKGFSSSDVALLKINVKYAPLLIPAKNPITLNEKISLFGFPSDAENKLTNNRTLDVTVTNGSVSSIREAAGSSAKLYQSDADASHGNSGGPAVNDVGEVFGVLTYRYASGNATDASKSYIRDIEDFTKLVEKHGVTLHKAESTQHTWEEGLALFGREHYSAALAKFETVKRTYPSHRLAGTYIEYAQQAISNGKDRQQLSIPLLIIGTLVGLSGMSGAIVLISRQYGRHRVYRTFHLHGLVAQSHSKA